MGQGRSKQPPPAPIIMISITTNKGNSICVDCDKKTQTDLPSNDATSSSGQPCASFYKSVSECMKVHDGLIAPCSKHWEAFQKCHQERQQQRHKERQQQQQ